ncbi:MAG TPA: HIT family protein [Candidatus Limnocylindrales bacterium]|nr:HIT family protein [Candidatus Limnocylindrales bacterium]
MEDSVFTKIIKGEIPCHKVYEDDNTLAFMDIHPIQPGHVLVVPKIQVGHFFDLADPDYLALMTTVKKVAQKLQQAFPEKPRVCVIIEGFDTPEHVHVKVFPASSGDELRYVPDMNGEPDHPALAAMAEKLTIR